MFALAACGGDSSTYTPAPLQAVPEDSSARKAADDGAPVDQEALAQRVLAANERVAALDPQDSAAVQAALTELTPGLREVVEKATDKSARIGASVLLGNLYELHGDRRAAISFYSQARDLSPEDPEIHQLLAIVLADDKQYARAATMQRVYVEHTPYDLEGHLLLGQLFTQAGNNDEAIQAYAGYEVARQVLMDCLVGKASKEGDYLKPTDERRICALALAPAIDNGTAVALSSVLTTEPEIVVREAVVETMGKQRLAGYAEPLTAYQAIEKENSVREAIAWALAEIARAPVETKQDPVPEQLAQEVAKAAEEGKGDAPTAPVTETADGVGPDAKATEAKAADAEAEAAEAKAAEAKAAEAKAAEAKAAEAKAATPGGSAGGR